MAISPQERPAQSQPNDAFQVHNLLMSGLVRAYELAAEQESRADSAESNLATTQEEAMLDPLTGLHNRRAFSQTYLELQASTQHQPNGRESSGTNEPTSLLLIDLDHFKSVNDTFGHDGGDQVLKLASGVINDRLRK